MPLRCSTVFNSSADSSYQLHLSAGVDGDLHIGTLRLRKKDEAFQNAAIRLRTYSGGGNNVVLHGILGGLLVDGQDRSQPDFLHKIFPADYKEFSFRCDDNPGSHLKILIADKVLGFQTNCHDEELDSSAGGHVSIQGDGPIVWINKNMVPKVYQKLQHGLVDNVPLRPSAMGRPAFKFFDPAARVSP